MNACLSRFVLLSTVLCLGPAIVDRWARAEEKSGDAATALPQQAAQAVLRALGLSDAPAVPAAPSRSVLAEALSATAAPPSMVASTLAQSSAVSFDPQAPIQARQVLQILGFMPAEARAAAPAARVAASVATPVQAPAGIQETPEAPVAAAAPVDAAKTIAAPAPAPAQAAGQSPWQWTDRTVVALDETALDTMRGGFIGDGGLKISFGIERAVYINGNLVTTTSLNLSELGTLSAGKAAAMKLPEVGNRIALIQNGAGNAVLTNLGPGAIGTVIQNTLDGQKIQTLTTINATANSLGVLKSIEAQRNLRSAITDSLRR